MAHPFDLTDFVQQLPKTETHLHLEGSLPLELARNLDPERFAGPPPYWQPDFRFHDFAEFQEEFDRYFFRWFVSPENYYDSCKIVFERLVAQNCVSPQAGPVACATSRAPSMRPVLQNWSLGCF
jgi:adenosine deaminase